jgi:DNA-binding NarL/FixJ family response regulator
VSRQRDTILTQREREMLALVGRGLSNQDIADRLFISTYTVKTCLHRICFKLEASNRAQAFFLTMKRGLLNVYDLHPLEDLTDFLVPPAPEDKILTPRERQVLALVCWGLSNKEISEHLSLSTRTVKTCLYHVCCKLGVANRIQAVTLALKQGILYAVDIFSPEELADIVAALGPEAVEMVSDTLEKKLGSIEHDELSGRTDVLQTIVFQQRLISLKKPSKASDWYSSNDTNSSCS